MLNEFNKVFQKYGFEILESIPNRDFILAWVDGKDVGFYLKIQSNYFSAYCRYDFMQSNVIESQYFSDIPEIEAMLLKNYVFEEQVQNFDGR